MTLREYNSNKRQIKKNMRSHIKLNHTFVKAENTAFGRQKAIDANAKLADKVNKENAKLAKLEAKLNAKLIKKSNKK